MVTFGVRVSVYEFVEGGTQFSPQQYGYDTEANESHEYFLIPNTFTEISLCQRYFKSSCSEKHILLLKKAKTFLYSMGNKNQIHQNYTRLMIELRPHPSQI